MASQSKSGDVTEWSYSTHTCRPHTTPPPRQRGGGGYSRGDGCKRQAQQQIPRGARLGTSAHDQLADPT
jgi:hypothetical protein